MHHQNPHLQNDYPIFDYSAVQQFSRVFKACYSDIKVRRETVSFYDSILPQLHRATSVICHLFRVTFMRTSLGGMSLESVPISRL